MSQLRVNAETFVPTYFHSINIQSTSNNNNKHTYNTDASSSDQHLLIVEKNKKIQKKKTNNNRKTSHGRQNKNEKSNQIETNIHKLNNSNEFDKNTNIFDRKPRMNEKTKIKVNRNINHGNNETTSCQNNTSQGKHVRQCGKNNKIQTNQRKSRQNNYNNKDKRRIIENNQNEDNIKQNQINTEQIIVTKDEDEKNFPSLIIPVKEDEKSKTLVLNNSLWKQNNVKIKLQIDQKDNDNENYTMSDNMKNSWLPLYTNVTTELTFLKKENNKKTLQSNVSINLCLDGLESMNSKQEMEQPMNQSQHTISTDFVSTSNLKKQLDSEVFTESQPNKIIKNQFTKPRILRNVDMTKLRDRWWEVLQQHYEKQIKEETLIAQEILESKDNSIDDVSTNKVYLESHPVYKNNDVIDYVVTKIEKPVAKELSGSLNYPLDELFMKNDLDTIKHILKEANEEYFANFISGQGNLNKMYPIQLVVSLNRPNLLQIILNSCRKRNLDWNSIKYENDFPPPLLIASEHGYDECIEILLNSFVVPISILLMTKDIDGNTALHFACRNNSSLSTFQLLLNYASKAGNGKSSTSVIRILSSKNYTKLQTVLHYACWFGRVDIIDYILNKACNFSSLCKLLSMQDADAQTPLLSAIASGCTDIVMSMLMWRGNNSLHQRYRYMTTTLPGVASLSETSASSTVNAVPVPSPCPLLWAICKSNNVEMVSLLLEFNSPLPDDGYNLDSALQVAVNVRISSYKSSINTLIDDMSIMEIIRVLVAAGANPCSGPEQSNFAASKLLPNSSIVTYASASGDYECMTLLLDSYKNFLDRLQNNRRCDPKVQKQPESFFASIESRENSEYTSAMCEALLQSLFNSWKLASRTINGDRYSGRISYHNCSVALYQRGAVLGNEDISRLCSSFSRNVLIPPQTDSTRPSNPKYTTACERIIAPKVILNEIEITEEGLRIVMLNMPWSKYCQPSQSTCHAGCAWIQHHIQKPDILWIEKCSKEILTLIGAPDIVLFSSDGYRFTAHSIILSEFSQKLAASIRFASMSDLHNAERFDKIDNYNYDSSMELMELHVDIPCQKLKWMLEHMYHGSIAVLGYSDISPADFCEDILELLLIADEFLCPSLVQECEMRLLAADYCRCYCWQCNTSCQLDSDTYICFDNKNTFQPIQKSQCSYSVSGPSLLITPTNAMNILAVSQQFNTPCDYRDYTVCSLSLNPCCSLMKPTKQICRRPLETLREVAVSTMLQNLSELINSDFFPESLKFLVNEDADKSQHAKVDESHSFDILLDILMHELNLLTSAEDVKVEIVKKDYNSIK